MLSRPAVEPRGWRIFPRSYLLVWKPDVFLFSEGVGGSFSIHPYWCGDGQSAGSWQQEIVDGVLWLLQLIIQFIYIELIITSVVDSDQVVIDSLFTKMKCFVRSCLVVHHLHGHPHYLRSPLDCIDFRRSDELRLMIAISLKQREERPRVCAPPIGRITTQPQNTHLELELSINSTSASSLGRNHATSNLTSSLLHCNANCAFTLRVT